MFLVDLALALVGRAAPQMNLMMLGFPLKISVGFFFMGLSCSRFWPLHVQGLYWRASNAMFAVMLGF